MDSSSSSSNATQTETCNAETSVTFFVAFCVDVILILFLCKLMHAVLGRFRQPRIISEFFVGILIGNFPGLSEIVANPLENGFRAMESFSSALYMFVLGLEMEPLAILRPPGPEAKIAYAGIISTWAIFILIYAYSYYFKGFKLHAKQASHNPRVLAAYAVMFSAASSPIITRLITELKLGQSEIGRRAIRAGLANDLVCTIIMAFIIALRESKMEILVILLSVIAEMIFIVGIMRYLFRWVNSRNPEGKPMKGLDMTIIVLLTQLLCHIAEIFRYDPKVNSFLIGLALPRQGRVSNFLISKINYVLTAFILPLYLSMAGIKLQFKSEDEESAVSWNRMVIISILATAGKLLCTLAISLRHGLHWLEAITLGVLLSMKGYFQIFFAMYAKNMNLMSERGFMLMLFLVVASIIYVPATVSIIIHRVRKLRGGKARLMGLQWYNPSSELRVTIALQNAQNVPASMSLVEMMRSGSTAGTVVYATDMVELTEHNKAALVYRQGSDAVMVADNAVIELREQIGIALDMHLDVCGREGITLTRNLAISSFSDMHNDICCSAQDSLSVLIVLPFHKSQKPDGAMDLGDPGFRTVNENVLQNSACSVGILVDRGLGQSSSLSMAEEALLNVVVVFIGGVDDREALAFAGIIAQHPTTRLLTIRFIPDREAMAADGPGRRILAAMPQREMEMEMDDEYFAGFYNHYVMNGRVGYMERHVKNGAESVRILRELEGNYQLFIVGQGSSRNSILTAGLSEWAECPELGPIGDILAASDFPSTASVLVIKQHNPAVDSKYISDEFMPF